MAKRATGFLIFRQINNQIEYLLLKASYGSRHWTPPKGHVDPGEDDFTTALRETREEAGYTADDLTIYMDQKQVLEYRVKNKPKTVVYWLARLVNPTKAPILSEEHTEFEWLQLEDAIKQTGFTDFENMLRYFHDKIPQLLS